MLRLYVRATWYITVNSLILFFLGICTQKRALGDSKSFDGMMAAMSLPTMQQENFHKTCLQGMQFHLLIR